MFACFIFTSILLFIVSSLPYEYIKLFVDLIASDGNAESYTIVRHRLVGKALGLASILLFIFSIGGSVYTKILPSHALTSYKNILVNGSILVLPFLVLIWLIPIFSVYTIGNDYAGYSINQQMELMFSIKSLTYPLFVPGFEGGHSSAALTLGQLWHPISRIASISPGYWNGHALEWGTFYRLLSLGVANLVIFHLLNKLNITPVMSFILSFIAIYNLRMLDLFRYGASLEAYSGLFFLMAAIGFHYLQKASYSGIIWITLATYWLTTSGHPQFFYLCLLSVFLYGACVPFIFQAIGIRGETPTRSVFRFYCSTIIAIFLGFLLSSNYLIPFIFEVLVTNSERVGKAYELSLGYQETPIGLLNSFFYPLYSDVHGNFGGSTLFILFLFCTVFGICKRIPLVVWIIWASIIGIFILGLGDMTILHYFYWKILPFTDSQRIAGRITVLIPPLIMLLLSWHFRLSTNANNLANATVKPSNTSIIFVTSISIYIVYFLWVSKYWLTSAYFTPLQINSNHPEYLNYVVFGLGVLSLISLWAYQINTHREHHSMQFGHTSAIVSSILCISVLLHVGLQLRYGTWVLWKSPMVTFETMNEDKSTSVLYAYNPPANVTYGMRTDDVVTYQNNTFKSPPLAKFYFSSIHTSNSESVYRLLKKPENRNVAIVENKDIAKDREFLNLVPNASANLTLNYNTFNRFDFTVSSSTPAWFVLGLPYSYGAWRVQVDNVEFEPRRVNGNLVGVQLPKGIHSLNFLYTSKSTIYGFILSSFAAIILLGIGIKTNSYQQKRSTPRLIFLLVLIFAHLFTIIDSYNSLYKGNSLKTIYSKSYSSIN